MSMGAMLATSMGMNAISTAMKYSTAKNQASAAKQVAQYNASLDINQAKQIELDTNFNISQERQQGKAYLSKQAAAYSASGVLISGSPLAVMATTAGKLEMNIQNEYIASQRKQAQLYSAAQQGIQVGEMQASGYKMKGMGELLSGGATLAGQYYGGVQKGIFTSPSAGRI